MTQKTTVIAVDAMGGDNAPSIVIEGLARVLKKDKHVFFQIYGNEEKILPFVQEFNLDKDKFKIHHTTQVIKPDDKPSYAIRNGRESSMFKAIMSVRNGYADAVISAGNTGALMAISKICLGTIAGIDRPAIAAVLPTLNGPAIALDLGANAVCSSKNLVEFSIMGSALHRILFKTKKPSVGLLNIGSEDTKGRDEIKEAAQQLKEVNDINFYGFIEGNDIGKGTTNVIVTDGFSGNVALKSIEGTVKFISGTLKRIAKRSFLRKLVFLLALPTLKIFKTSIDPRQYNGAMFIGLNGVSVKSHGASDAFSFSCAVHHALDMARHNLCAQIRQDVEKIIESQDKEKAK